MNLLNNWKLILSGTGIIVILLSLANHAENQGIRTEEASKWKEAIANAKPVVVHETTYVPQKPIIGTAESKVMRFSKADIKEWESFINSVHSNNDQTPEKCDSLLHYAEYLEQDFTTFIDTAGISGELVAHPKTQTVDYKLQLPPQLQEHTTTTKEVVAPTIDKNWVVGLDMGYHEEPRIGGLLGRKPVIIGADYYPEAKQNKWGGHLQLQLDF